MKVLVCGDTHGTFDGLMGLIVEKKPDLVIICGDFGYFPRIAWVAKNIFELSDFLVLHGVKLWFVKGNHEDHDTLDKISSNPAIMPVAPSIYYVSNGYVATIGKRRVLFMGGARSIDWMYRKKDIDWFPQEMVKSEDIEHCQEQIYDTVISHTAPSEFHVFGNVTGNYDFDSDVSRDLLSQILNSGNLRHWFFGHWHKYFYGIHQFDGESQCIWRGLNVADCNGGYILEEW